jgi:hypothetical protein
LLGLGGVRYFSNYFLPQTRFRAGRAASFGRGSAAMREDRFLRARLSCNSDLSDLMAEEDGAGKIFRRIINSSSF